MYSSAAPPPHPRAPPACQTEPPPPLTAPLPLSGSRSLHHCSESLGSSGETLKLVSTPGADCEEPRQTFFFSFAPRRPRRSSGGLLLPNHLHFVYTAWISPSDLHHGKHRRLLSSAFRGGGGPRPASREVAREEEALFLPACVHTRARAGAGGRSATPPGFDTNRPGSLWAHITVIPSLRGCSAD